MVDEFGRTLEEQVQDQIQWEYFHTERDHVIKKEYTSDTAHQDSDFPYRMQITYKDGGPSYYVNDYFPHFHYQTGAALADHDYDLLIEYRGSQNVNLEDLEAESDAIDTLIEEGAVDDISKLDLD